MTTDRSDVAADLRSWARGMHCTEAATLILIRAFGGRFAQPGWPWIARSRHDGSFYIDADRMSDDDIGMLSGGEQRTFAIVRSLLGEEPVDLSDAITGLDLRHARIVIDALEHAAGGARNRPAPPVAATRDFGVSHDSTPRRPHGNESKGITR